MTLILSCITAGEAQARRTLDQLLAAGTGPDAIIVLHPTTPPPAQPTGHLEAPSATSTAGSAASASAAAGMFGWLIGYGVLSIPGALLGGAVGAVAGAAIGALRHTAATHVPAEVHHHYAGRIADDRAAILVRVADMAGYQRVLEVFLAAGGRHILTSRDDALRAEADQLQAIAQDSAGGDRA